MSKYPQFPVIDDESFDLLFHTIVTHMGFYDKEFIILSFSLLSSYSSLYSPSARLIFPVIHKSFDLLFHTCFISLDPNTY